MDVGFLADPRRHGLPCLLPSGAPLFGRPGAAASERLRWPRRLEGSKALECPARLPERRSAGGLGRSRRLDRVRGPPGKGEVAHVLHGSERRRRHRRTAYRIGHLGGSGPLAQAPEESAHRGRPAILRAARRGPRGERKDVARPVGLQAPPDGRVPRAHHRPHHRGASRRPRRDRSCPLERPVLLGDLTAADGTGSLLCPRGAAARGARGTLLPAVLYFGGGTFGRAPKGNASRAGGRHALPRRRGPLGPFRFSTHDFLIGDPAGSLYSGKLIDGPDGRPNFLAWRNFTPDGVFVGELADPFQVAVDGEGNLAVLRTLAGE